MTRPAETEETASTEASCTRSVDVAGKKSLTSIGNYRVAEPLGKGNFAKVVQAVHTVLKSKVAVKIIDTSKVSQEYVLRNLYREARILSKLNHPNIIRLYETIQCGAVYYLVTELATGGDLGSHVRSQPGGRLDEVSARSYARQLADGLQHMHSRNIVHRDLKMENIMLQDEKKEWIKIIDFGLSNVYSEENPLKTLCGSPEYAAPELFVKGKRYGPEVDLWSLGVILYVMGTGRLPFTSPRDESTSADERRRRLMAQINRGLGAPQERLIVTLSADYKNLLRLALAPTAHRRIRLDELRRHPWIDARVDSISSAEKFQLCLAERLAIARDVAVIVGMDFREVEVDIVRQRFGSIGGMYNIMAHKMQLRKLRRCAEVESLRTPQKPNLEKSGDELPKKIKTNGTFSNVKHDYRSDRRITATQTEVVQNKILKINLRRVTVDPRCDLKKKSSATAIQPTLKKNTYSSSTQVQYNKNRFIQKQQKITKEPTKLKVHQFQIKSKIDHTTSVKKYATRSGNNASTKSEPGRTVSKSHDKIRRLFKRVCSEK